MGMIKAKPKKREFEMISNTGTIMNKQTKANFTLSTRRSVLTGLMLIGGGMMMASGEGIGHFFGTLFKYGFTSEGYHEMLRTSHDPDIRFGNFSPDGTKVVLNYRPMVDNEEGITYIGILEIATGKLQLIRPSQEYKMWYDGSFSPDGKEMVFSYTLREKVEENVGLGILNLNTLGFRVILKSNRGRQNTSFSPDGKHLIYFKVEYAQTKNGKMNYIGKDVYDMDLETQQENRLTNLHFFGGKAAPRYFPDGEKYIFAAEYPTTDLYYSSTRHHELYKENNTYVFNRNVLQVEAIPAIIHKEHSRFADISQDGKKILCIAMSDLHKYNHSKKYNYELFMYENAQMHQLTDLQWKIIDAALSPDGREAVFVADTTPSRGSEQKIYLYNLNTNTTTHIELKPENTTWLDAK